jgi:hypothetical protein
MVEHVEMNAEQQESYIKRNKCYNGGNQLNVLKRYQELNKAGQGHLAQELWKYCALYVHGGLYVDATSPMLYSTDDLLSSSSKSNMAVLSSDDYFPRTIHGAVLGIKEPRSSIAQNMLQILMDTPIEALSASPLLLPRSLFDLVSQQNKEDWYLLEQHCSVDPLRRRAESISSTDTNSLRLTHNCPQKGGYCCQIHDPVSHTAVFMTQHPLLPYQVLPAISDLPLPLNPSGGHYEEEEVPFIATVREKVNPRPKEPLVTPNFFETLMKNNCLPSNLVCSNCLRNKEGADCNKCRKECPCYCKTLCHVTVEEKFVAKEVTIVPPLYSRDPSRLVPRIVHQTWFEEVTKEKYPNQSRLIESFKQSGWEYKFYTDEVARDFLNTHLPREVLEAYDALRPGAFKADLFRCKFIVW